MQIHFESGTLNPSPVVLRVPRRPVEREIAVTRAPVITAFSALRQAQREALRSHAVEQLVWFGLALAALGALVVSL